MYGLAQPLGQPVILTNYRLTIPQTNLIENGPNPLKMLGIPRSASVIASGHNGKAGHAIAVKLRDLQILVAADQPGLE